MPLSETEQERIVRQNSVFRRTEVLTGQQQPPPDAYEKTAGYYRDALDRIALLIDKRQETTERTVLTFAATRKSKAKTAAENSAIGFLAERVAFRMRKPHAKQVVIWRRRCSASAKSLKIGSAKQQKCADGSWCVRPENIARTHRGDSSLGPIFRA